MGSFGEDFLGDLAACWDDFLWLALCFFLCFLAFLAVAVEDCCSAWLGLVGFGVVEVELLLVVVLELELELEVELEVELELELEELDEELDEEPVPVELLVVLLVGEEVVLVVVVLLVALGWQDSVSDCDHAGDRQVHLARSAFPAAR